MQQRPEIAVLTPNILTGIGLKAIFDRVIPMAEVELFADFDRLAEAVPGRFVHFFVSAALYRRHAAFFAPLRRKVILLTSGRPHEGEAGLHALNVCDSEERLVHDLLQLHRGGHPQGHPSGHPQGHAGLPGREGSGEGPAMPRPLLTEREAEVLRALARGRINKQIADELGIGLATVVTHRRNIMEKLQLRSVAELMLYALRAGYVEEETV